MIDIRLFGSLNLLPLLGKMSDHWRRQLAGEMMGSGRGANCAPWSLAVTTIHRIVALFRSFFESLHLIKQSQ